MEKHLETFDNICIPTYVINMPERTDRRQSIIHEFKGRSEFDLHIVEAIKHDIGGVGLWKSIKGIVRDAEERGEDDVIIVCEDDHVFTKEYERDRFLSQVILAAQLNTHILYGGIGGFGCAVMVTDDMFWIDWSWCTQFMVIYKNAFPIILNSRFTRKDCADQFLSKIIPNKLVTFPFISVQKDFGYSDVTKENNIAGNITRMFDDTSKRIEKFAKISQELNSICRKRQSL